MAYSGWFEFGDMEIANIGRSVRLAAPLGIEAVFLSSERIEWLEDRLDGVDYDDVQEAPWYDPLVPASAEFGGFLPLRVDGLSDSTHTAATSEYITKGGSTAQARRASATFVFSGGLLATSERGAEYGKRWLSRALTAKQGPLNRCSGADLRYLRYEGSTTDVLHRRDVHLTRGISVTKEWRGSCSVVWMVTFTMVADDPDEYGEPVSALTNLGGGAATGPLLDAGGSTSLTMTSCPTFDYMPLYDPLMPALVAPPTAPTFLPEGWAVLPGSAFKRWWARVDEHPLTALLAVPYVKVDAEEDVRNVRISFWENFPDPTEQCGPLISIVVGYLPAGRSLYIDGEQQAAYLWDGASLVVTRADTVIYGASGGPVEWASFPVRQGFAVTVDEFSSDGAVHAEVSLIPVTN